MTSETHTGCARTATVRRSKPLMAVLSISCGIGAVLTGISLQPPAAVAKPKAQIAWDWTGIIGTGQSLSVGDHGRPAISTSQPYQNLQLSTGSLPWPVDPNDPTLSLVPLIEPIGRPSTAYPSSWPTNIAGETFHTSMANELTALVLADMKRDFVTVQSEVGENGQGIEFLKKDAIPTDVRGRSFKAALIETMAINRLAKAAGKTYGVGAIVVTHGEHDAGDTSYAAELHQLWQDYNADLRAITGQKQPILMIVSQQNAVNDHSASTIAQWKVGVDYKADIVCSGPKYQYPYARDGVHLIAEGYRLLGEKYAQVYYQRAIRRQRWEPLQPTKAGRKGTVITVQFHVPVAPLVWDDTLGPPHSTEPEWQNGKGFEVSTAAGAKIAITSVAIAGDSVVFTCASDPGPGARVGYAMEGEKTPMSVPYRGTRRWGLLRDSDPFQGAATGKPQPNYAVAFDMTVR